MIIYHLVPKSFYDRQRKNAVYLPKPYLQDGFIHCTKKAKEMANVANRFYNQERGPHVYLYIDTRKVNAKIRYDDTAKKYPHIYGGLNHDAIVAIKPARKDAEGRFLPPERLT
jgi:glutathione S-transferase